MGDDLTEFVTKPLLSYLARFHTASDHPDTIEYEIGEIFGEIRNKGHSGYNLREIPNGWMNCGSVLKHSDTNRPLRTRTRSGTWETLVGTAGDTKRPVDRSAPL